MDLSQDTKLPIIRDKNEGIASQWLLAMAAGAHQSPGTELQSQAQTTNSWIQ